jgi:hypothetical protein
MRADAGRLAQFRDDIYNHDRIGGAGSRGREGNIRMDGDGSREVLFEFTAVGAVMKVAAIDAETGVEVMVMGPAHARRADLQKLALAKLRQRLKMGGNP